LQIALGGTIANSLNLTVAIITGPGESPLCWMDI